MSIRRVEAALTEVGNTFTSASLHQREDETKTERERQLERKTERKRWNRKACGRIQRLHCEGLVQGRDSINAKIRLFKTLAHSY